MRLFNLQISALLAALFLLTYTTSCGVSKKAGKDIRSEKALLWEIKVPGAKSPSYVFGTIHLIDKENFFLPAGTMTAFDKSQKVFFEIDMADMNDMSAMMGLMDKLLMKDGKSLQDLLSSTDYEKVNSFFKSKGLPLMFLERMKPMFLTVLTYSDMKPGALQTGDMKSYEFEFMEMATQTKKPTAGLETIEFQIGVFDKIPYETQAKMLVDAIDQSSGTDDEFAKMVELYKQQDIDALVTSIGESESGLGDFEDVLLHERNKNWIPIIIEEAKKQPGFFAVGAGHLAGKYGVLNLLKEQGVVIKPVKE